MGWDGMEMGWAEDGLRMRVGCEWVGDWGGVCMGAGEGEVCIGRDG